MITLPNGLNKFMKGQKLDGLKPFALLFRNKWDSVNNKYALDTTPIDISGLIVKPNTLSMTLDVNEIAQYNANNVTLTLSDTKNYFVEGTPDSYFPDGYQLYGSRVVLYYGTDSTNSTPLFTGVIKEPPTHKPESYQVDVKLVSPLEMLKDIEAKEFSDKVTGEVLTYIEDDSDGHKVYHTAGTGVGGFDAVYADGGKLFEGVDYEVEQLNALGLPAIVTIINSDYYYSTISADYYTWKTGLTVEQIVAGLVGLAGYDSSNEDIRNVVWNSAVRSQENSNQIITVGYKKNGIDYLEKNEFGDGNFTNTSNLYRYSYLPSNFKIALNVTLKSNLSLNNQQTARTYFLGSINTMTGIALAFEGPWYWQPQYTYPVCRIIAYKVVNGTYSGQTFVTFESKNASSMTEDLEIEKNGNTVTITGNNATATYTFDNDFSFGINEEWNEYVYCHYTNKAPLQFNSYKISLYNDDNAFVENNGILVENTTSLIDRDWDIISATISPDGLVYHSFYRLYSNGTWADWQPYSLNSIIGTISQKIQFRFLVQSGSTDIEGLQFQYLSSTLVLQIVNLSGLTVLEALQDFALISGYEFGVDRQGVFFFKPRVASTTPTYVLDHDEVVKVDTVKKNLSDFFTKLTLTFAQVPLEFYANTGERPTLVDKYGIINKEIDKPDIVNYDNPELAQAIGTQLLEVYSSMPNIIQAVGKLNLALELGDIVSLRRNFNLVEPNSATDYAKYITQQTYYRACKITGMNYNFSKKQITYTLRDVSNSNTEPTAETVGHYIYELPIELGV
jgi:hypothetical protein